MAGWRVLFISLLMSLCSLVCSQSIPFITTSHPLNNTLFKTFTPPNRHPLDQQDVDDPYFQNLYYDEKNPYVLYVTGNRNLYRLNSLDVSDTSSDRFLISPRFVTENRRGTIHWRISLIANLTDELFFVCTTGETYTRKWEVRKDTLTPVNNSARMWYRSNFDTAHFCPRVKDQNYTKAEMEIYNVKTLLMGTQFTPGGLNSAGVIRRVQLVADSDPIGVKDNRPAYLEGDSGDGSYNYATFQSASFVASIEVGDFVFLFLTDSTISSSVGYVNDAQLPGRQAKVVRLCKNETANMGIGGVRNNWATIRQIRLECNIHGPTRVENSQLDLRNIVDVKYVAEDEVFMALFNNAFSGSEYEVSAVCMFELSEIQRAINSIAIHRNLSGEWFHDVAYRPYQHYDWQPTDVLKTQCEFPTSPLPDPREFWYNRPGMQIATAKHVAVERDSRYVGPLFYSYGILGRKLAVERVIRNGQPYIIMFIITNEGKVLRASQPVVPIKGTNRIPHSVDNGSSLLSVTSPFSLPSDQRLVYELRIIKHSQQESLYLVAPGAVVQMKLHECGVYTSWETCVRDPVCGWHSGVCRVYDGSMCLKECGANTVPQHEILTNGQPKVIKFSCHAPFMWLVDGKNLTELNMPEHVLLSSNAELVVLNPTDALHEKQIKCVERRSAESVFDRMLIVNDNRYQQAFDQWCEEFETYQQAMRPYLKQELSNN